MKYRCVFWDKTWDHKPTRQEVIAHFFDDHQGNLSFLPDDQVFLNVEVFLDVKEVEK